MKNKNGKRRQVKLAGGRGAAAGESSLGRVIYGYALLAERGSLALKSWSNLPHEAWQAPGFQPRLRALFEDFRASGAEMALIALTRAPDPAQGLQLLPLEGLNRAMFFQRHPMRTLSEVVAFQEAQDGQAPPEVRTYVGTAVGGHGFCTDALPDEPTSSTPPEVQP